ncbi:MAG TPA: hypothetical protein VK788_03490 [Terriglobales bacterium]|jgi:hypothetical protein|nr:hypothetical protein [Terriglobales bacterium]
MALAGLPQHLNVKETSQQIGKFSLRTSKTVAALLAVILCVTFYSFRSNSLIGDGLRHLQAFRIILPGTPPTFQTKPWLEVYRNHYNDLVVHNHFLYGITMRSAFALQQELGIRGDAIVAMQAVNSLCAAVAAALFFLLGVRVGLPGWVSLGVTLGLCLSPVYLLAATNIAEVGLALPFFVGTLLLLAGRQLSGWTLVAAGALAGLTAIFYAVAGFLVPGIAAALILTRFPFRSAIKQLLLFLSAAGGVFAGIWVTVLVASGYHTLSNLCGAIFQFPQQGTFLNFKLGSLVATPVGLTQGFLPVLPADFVGLRSLYQQAPWSAACVTAATLFVVAFLAAISYVLFKRGMLRTPLVLSCLLTFLLVEAACVKWDTYYQKLHLFAVILCWVMVLVALLEPQPFSVRWPALLFVILVSASGLWVLKKNVEPSQMQTNAQQLVEIVGNGELITTWSGDVMHMFLYSNLGNVVSLPDLAFARRLDSPQAQGDLEIIIQQAMLQGRSVYFYGLFDEKSGHPYDIYETRFREKGMTAYLSILQRKARTVARLQQNGSQSIPLYQYVP